VRGDGSGNVHQVQDASAEDVAQDVRILGKDHFHHIYPRDSDRSCPSRRLRKAGAAPFRSLGHDETRPPQRIGVRQTAGYNTLVPAMTQPQKTRRQLLEDFTAAHPYDAFARYGLALECSSGGDHDAAILHFRQLLATHPGYVAGYFQLGQLLGRLGRTEEARQTLASGVTVAHKAGDHHAGSEMEAVLKELG